MSSVILAAMPAVGHTTPILHLANGLHQRHHQVTVALGTRFAPNAAQLGLRYVPLRGHADYDDRLPNPRRDALPAGTEQSVYDMIHLIGDALADQYLLLQELLTEDPDAVLVVDGFFLGAWPTLLGAPGIRPRRVVGIGAIPLMIRSRDTGPFGPVPPAPGQTQAEANLALYDALEPLVQQGQTHIEQQLRRLGVTHPIPPLVEGMVHVPDAFAQLSAAQFEFPRTDGPHTLHYIGALPPPPTPPDWQPPPWWTQLHPHQPARRPVLLVTQGTIANTDLTQLIEPTLTACAHLPVTVIAALGRPRTDHTGTVPDNAILTDWVPYNALLPHTDLFITNGGYGGVQQALTHGIPVLTAGTSEDKPMVAARITHHGLGLDLATNHPTPQAITHAVTTLLHDHTTTSRVHALQHTYATLDTVTELETLLT